MLVATKVKLSMERLVRLNGVYGGKGSGRSPVQSDGWSRRSIDRESKQYMRISGIVRLQIWMIMTHRKSSIS